jgi:hypothetical protein
LVSISSAGTFWNWMVMLGCCALNLAYSFFIPSSWPTQEANEICTGAVGSGTSVADGADVGAELDPGEVPDPPPQAATRLSMSAPARIGSERRGERFLIEPPFERIEPPPVDGANRLRDLAWSLLQRRAPVKTAKMNPSCIAVGRIG